MNRQNYLGERYRQLNDPSFYKRVNEDPTEDINKRVRFYLKRLLANNIIYIDKQTHCYHTPENPKAGRSYILSKIHKPGNPGRPIVSAHGHRTEKISELGSFHLNPLVQTLPSYVKNTTHLLNKLQDFDDIPPNALLVTLDVSSLYTNIPTTEGINACRKLLHERTEKHLSKSIPTETLCDLMCIILAISNFVCNDEHFIQQHGTAMGTRMAPAFANLFMGEFERKVLEGYVDKPFLWLRYIDDILMVWTQGNEKLDSFIAYLNSIHPTIKFTSERSTTSIPFFDVKILLENGKIETDLYCKPTDKHQYFLVLHSSSHPYHTKKSIPTALRLRRICSKDEFFDTRSTELERYVTKRGLKENSPEIKKPDSVPFITTYNPALPNIHKVLRQKQPILHSTERLHDIFKETPVVAYRRSPNIRDLLVRAKLQNPGTAIQPFFLYFPLQL